MTTIKWPFGEKNKIKEGGKEYFSRPDELQGLRPSGAVSWSTSKNVAREFSKMPDANDHSVSSYVWKKRPDQEVLEQQVPAKNIFSKNIRF